MTQHRNKLKYNVYASNCLFSLLFVCVFLILGPVEGSCKTYDAQDDLVVGVDSEWYNDNMYVGVEDDTVHIGHGTSVGYGDHISIPLEDKERLTWLRDTLNDILRS